MNAWLGCAQRVAVLSPPSGLPSNLLGVPLHSVCRHCRFTYLAANDSPGRLQPVMNRRRRAFVVERAFPFTYHGVLHTHTHTHTTEAENTFATPASCRCKQDGRS